jgi:hypothetical protein
MRHSALRGTHRPPQTLPVGPAVAGALAPQTLPVGLAVSLALAPRALPVGPAVDGALPPRALPIGPAVTGALLARPVAAEALLPGMVVILSLTKGCHHLIQRHPAVAVLVGRGDRLLEETRWTVVQIEEAVVVSVEVVEKTTIRIEVKSAPMTGRKEHE